MIADRIELRGLSGSLAAIDGLFSHLVAGFAQAPDTEIAKEGFGNNTGRVIEPMIFIGGYVSDFAGG